MRELGVVGFLDARSRASAARFPEQAACLRGTASTDTTEYHRRRIKRATQLADEAGLAYAGFAVNDADKP